MPAPVLILACGAIARELALLRQVNGWTHVQIRGLPATLHQSPAHIPAAVRAQIEAAAGRHERIFVAYADCGTAGELDRMLGEYGIERLPGAHCYEYLTGQAAFRELADAEPGTYYLTDFLVRHFERVVVESLGLRRHPQLLSIYFRNYRRLVHLAQSDSPTLEAQARTHADFLGLEYRRHYTGLEPLAHALESRLRLVQEDAPATATGRAAAMCTAPCDDA